jgi:hypothetical protein
MDPSNSFVGNMMDMTEIDCQCLAHAAYQILDAMV